MKIINLESIEGGYAGFYTRDFRQYNRFRITPANRVENQMKVPPEVQDYNEFSRLWKQINPATRLLKTPVEIHQLTLEELRKAASSLKPDYLDSKKPGQP